MDRERGCAQKGESKWSASIIQTYIDGLNKQIRKLTNEVTQLSLDNTVKAGIIKQLEIELEIANKERNRK